MNVGSTFSGVGGFDLGLERAGMRIAWQAESDEWCRSILAHHWPGVPCYDDVRDVASSAREHRREGLRDGDHARATTETRNGRAVDLLCGGFPCQDLSVAGKRAGLAGERSGLFHEFARIADALRPSWVLLENVPGLLSSNDGRDFGVVLGTLADLGYGVAWRVLDSRYFGVPQRRRRVFIVGRLGGDDGPALRALCESCPGSPPTSLCSWQDATPRARGRIAVGEPVSTLQGAPGRGYRVDAEGAAGGHLVPTAFHMIQDPISTIERSPALGVKSSGMGVAFSENQRGELREHEIDMQLVQGGGKPGQGYPAIRQASGVRRLTPRECERLQAFPDDWTLIPGHKCPDSRRYAAMGNAVTVNVAEWIGRRILAVENP